MAHTKQTPRNPVLERPSAAMGSDVQERRVPSKTYNKENIKRSKINLANICYIKCLNAIPQLVELGSHIITTQDYWHYVKYVDTNSLPKA